MNLLLIGLRGSGKSTVGRLVAERLGKPFVDLDALTPGTLRCRTVAEAWTKHGEAEFRRAEAMNLHGLLEVDDRVIALGGGTPTAPGAAEQLRGAVQGGTIIVYLCASAATLRSRLETAGNAHRPSLTGADMLTEIDTVLAQRDPLYRSLATDVVFTDRKTEAEVVSEILDILA